MSLSDTIKKNFPVGIAMPEEVAEMIDYIEENTSEYFQIDMQFYPVSHDAVKYYFNNSEPINYLGLLGVKADGSIIAIWKDGDIQRFIHLGSEGNDWLILASDPIDFIKVIAVGYIDFVKGEVLNPPKKTTIDKSFQDWVEKTFSVTVPESGKGIIDNESEKLADWIKSKMNF